MPATVYKGSSASFSNLGGSPLNPRRDQSHSIEDSTKSLELELDSFQRKVTDRFMDLSSSSNEDFLSLSWVRKLLDTFLCCQEDFSTILNNHITMVLRPPMDRLVSEYYERSVKALDVCNAIRDGIEQVRQWMKLLEIVLSAFSNHKKFGEPQFRRAKKALVELAIGMLDGKDSNATVPHRNRSFDRNKVSKEHHFRSLSWSVSRTWSAARQLQAIGNNLYPPKGTDLVATHGLALPVYTMNSVLLFVIWALVAAIPCQDRGLHVHFSISRQLPWSSSILSLNERIMEESKKRERKNACGLLKEIHQIEKFAKAMNELSDSVHFPMTEEKDVEVRKKVQELSELCEAMKGGLDPLERQVREVFHRIVSSRSEGLDSIGRQV